MESAMPMPATPADAQNAACGCDWTPALAECLAKIFGIAPLSELQWRVISECREEWARRGVVPDLSSIASATHLSCADVESLFPGESPGLPWILAGLAPPTGVARAHNGASPAANHAGLTRRSRGGGR